MSNVSPPRGLKAASSLPKRGVRSEQRLGNHRDITKHASVKNIANDAELLAAQAIGSPGQPLDLQTRAFMESSFEHDFSQVRVHADEQAAESAQSLNAHAYTFGNDIVFGHGQYAPHTNEGRLLLAHELIHTVQQGPMDPQRLPNDDMRISEPRETQEQEARSLSEPVGIEQNNPLGSVKSGGSIKGVPIIQRREATEAPPLQLTPPSILSPSEHVRTLTIESFVTDKATIPNDQVAELDELAAAILSVLPTHPNAYITILGHTDAVGTEAHNLALGKDRAESVKKHLVAKKVPAESIKTYSFGASIPVVETKQANERNRRVEVIFDPQTSPSEKHDDRKAVDKEIHIPIPPLRLTLDTNIVKPTKVDTKPKADPKDDKKVKPAKTAEAKEAKDKEDEKPHLGLQGGIGEQVSDTKFVYAQFTLEWSDAFVKNFKNEDLPTWMRKHVDSIHILGEPGGTVQFHLAGDGAWQLDAQVMGKIVQLSLSQVDISAVLGAGYNDLAGKPKSNKGSIMGGGEIELKPPENQRVSIVIDVLGAYPLGKPDDAPPGARAHVQFQFTGEFRFKFK